MIHEAIYNLYPQVKTIQEKKDGTLIILDENKNEVIVDMSTAKTKATELQSNFDTAKANAITKKASGKQKLLDLGLTEEEVQALIGV